MILLRAVRVGLIEKGTLSKDLKEEKEFALFWRKDFVRRGKSKCKGSEVRAWPLVGGISRRQEWLGRAELCESRDYVCLVPGRW